MSEIMKVGLGMSWGPVGVVHGRFGWQHHQFSANKNDALKFKPKSLNKDGRRKELMRITQENQV
jgi:hypothetical protein